MGKGAKGINLTFIFILILVLVLIWASTNSGNGGSYTMAQFVSEMEEGLVVDVEIHPNAQVPTGMLRITLKDNQQRNLYVSDVVEAQEIVRGYNSFIADSAGGRGIYVQHDERPECRKQRR